MPPAKAPGKHAGMRLEGLDGARVPHRTRGSSPRGGLAGRPRGRGRRPSSRGAQDSHGSLLENPHHPRGPRKSVFCPRERTSIRNRLVLSGTLPETHFAHPWHSEAPGTSPILQMRLGTRRHLPRVRETAAGGREPHSSLASSTPGLGAVFSRRLLISSVQGSTMPTGRREPQPWLLRERVHTAFLSPSPLFSVNAILSAFTQSCTPKNSYPKPDKSP